MASRSAYHARRCLHHTSGMLKRPSALFSRRLETRRRPREKPCLDRLEGGQVRTGRLGREGEERARSPRYPLVPPP